MRLHFTKVGLPAGGDRFDLVSGEGYLVYMKAGKFVSFNNGIEDPALSLEADLNIITIPYTDHYTPRSYTSYAFFPILALLMKGYSIQRYNRKIGKFETTVYHYGKPAGINFEMVSGEAYLVHMKAARYIDFRLR